MRAARALAAGLLAALACSSAPADGPPLVVLVSIDTLRADFVGAYEPAARRLTPRLDRLARDGLVFERHITASPWTTPAHMSLFTSLRPSGHGVTASFEELTRDRLSEGRYVRLASGHATLPELLRRAGYATAAFTGGGTMDPAIGFGRGFDVYGTSMYKLGPGDVERLVDRVEGPRARPLFLFWHHFQVHAPYLDGELLDEVLPAPRAAALRAELDRWREEAAESPPTGLARIRRHRRMKELLRRHDAWSREVCEALYAGGVRAADRELGRLLARLRELGLYDPALIVVTSDHGEELGDHSPERFYDMHGHTVYEELAHVPLVLKLPGNARAGTRIDATTRMVDLLPTLLEVLGAEPPEGPVDGRSLAPLWEERRSRTPRPAFTEALAGPAEMKSVRTPRYTFLVSVGPRQVARHGRAGLPVALRARALFDRASDPREKRNLLAADPSPETKATAARLEARLRRWAAAPPGSPEAVELDDETLERLRSLGYVE